MENNSSVDTLRKRWAAFREKIPADPPLFLQPAWPLHGDPGEELVQFSAFSPSVALFLLSNPELSSLATVKTKSYRSSESACGPLLPLRQRRFLPTADFSRLRVFRRACWQDSWSETQEEPPSTLVWSQGTLLLASSHAWLCRGELALERAEFRWASAPHPSTSMSASSRALGHLFWFSSLLRSLSS